jgi:prophage tail gpP-like protein
VADDEPLDSITVEAYGTPGSSHIDFNFEDWTTFALTSSILKPAEASFELGDQTGWDRLAELVDLGSEFRVFVDDRLRLTGRIESLNSVNDARQSATQRFTIRTKLSDALFSSAPQNVRLQGRTLREFILALYKDLGLTEADFDFRGDVSRDVMTGRITRGPEAHGRRRGIDGRLLADPPRGFEAIEETEENSKVQPPESIFEAADRHLRRHGLLHWDGPDGRIVVAPPNDMQDALGVLRSIRGEDGGAGQFNNVLVLERDQDVSEAPTEMGVFGMGGKAGFSRASVSAVIRNQALIDRGFTRRAAVLDEGLTSKAIATRRACREFVTRSRGLDRLTVTVDGLSYRDGTDPVPWAPDTTVDVIDDTLGGVLGIYYVEEIQMQRDAAAGDVTRLSLVKQGVWQL